MKIPEGMSEQEVVEIMERVVGRLARSFRFGYHQTDDLKQEGYRFAIEVLNGTGYDAARPLENFLFHHVRNRLINYKRDNYVRNEPPCKNCIFYNPRAANKCGTFDDTDECKKLGDWKGRNAAKKSVMKPADISSVSEENMHQKSNTVDEASYGELCGKIDEQLPAELRADFLRMLSGQSIPKSRRDRVRKTVAEIMGIEE